MPATIIMKNSGWATLVNAQAGYDFDVMWGPGRTGTPVQGTISGEPPQVHMTAGCVYMAGTLPQPSPARRQSGYPLAGGPRVAGWPIIVTAYMSAAAEGTILFVDIVANEERVTRLDPPDSGTVYCTSNQGASEKFDDSASDERVMVWTPASGGTVAAPQNLGAVAGAQTFRNQVVTNAQNFQLRIP